MDKDEAKKISDVLLNYLLIIMFVVALLLFAALYGALAFEAWHEVAILYGWID